MGLFDFIERQRQKPEMARRRILASTTALATAVIVAIWLSTFSFETVFPEGKKVVEDEGPLKEIVATSGILFDNVKNVLDSVKTIFASSTPQLTASSSLPKSSE